MKQLRVVNQEYTQLATDSEVGTSEPLSRFNDTVLLDKWALVIGTVRVVEKGLNARLDLILRNKSDFSLSCFVYVAQRDIVRRVLARTVSTFK